MSNWHKFLAWLLEMLMEALMFSLVAIVMSDAGFPTVRDMAALMIAALTCFGISGYIVTTLVMRFALRGKWSQWYPAIAGLLFLAHFEIMNLLVSGGLLDRTNGLVFRVIGFAVVFASTRLITLVLERIGDSYN